MLNRVQHQIRGDLLQSFDVPLAFQVAVRVEINNELRISGLNFIDNLTDELSEVGLGRRNRHWTAKAAAREVEQVTDHAIQASRAVQNSRNCAALLFVQSVRGEQVRSERDGIDGASQIVSQNAEESIAVLSRALGSRELPPRRFDRSLRRTWLSPRRRLRNYRGNLDATFGERTSAARDTRPLSAPSRILIRFSG